MVALYPLSPKENTAFQSLQKLNCSHLLVYHISEEQKIRDLLLVLDRVPLSDPVRDQAILLRRNNRLKIPDAIIAACALTQHAILLTNDQSL